MKVKFKKAVALLMTVVIGSATLLSSSAYTRKTDCVPIILVPGYSSSMLVMDAETENEKQVWGLNMDEVGAAVLNNIANLGIGLGELAFGKTDTIVETVGREAKELLKYLALNPDTTSAYNISVAGCDVVSSCDAWRVEQYGERSVAEPEISAGFADVVGWENVFTFYTDFRQGAIQCAENLNEYIQQVKEYTGSDKVSIYAVSHGGQVTGTYLSLYGTNGDVDNAVLSVPALAGAGIAYDGFSGNAHLDEELLIYFIECGLVSETNFEWLLHANRLGILDEIINRLFQEYLLDVVGNWGSLWDFIPTQFYEEMKDKYLDKTQCSALIAKSDRMHYEIMANYASAFKAAQDAGVDISIMSSTGHRSVSGWNVNSDAIIPTFSSSGALCAPYGQRFSDGYKCTGSVCTDESHYHLSPSMEIDASYCYLPDNTWFVEGQFHGMSYWDIYSRLLARKLVLTDDISDVYSDPDYPQFGLTHNATDALYVEFDKSPVGFISSEDKALRVTNLSEKYPIKLLSATTEGMDLSISTSGAGIIAPGETVALSFRGSVPDVNACRAAVTVNFIQIGAVSSLSTKTFDYTIRGGKTVSYDTSNPFSDVGFIKDYGSRFLNLLRDIFERMGLQDLFTIIFSTIVSLIKVF